MQIAAGQSFTGQAPKQERIIHCFPIPEAYQKCLDGSMLKEVGIGELTPEEELMAARRAGGDQIVLAMELAKQSLLEVNGTQCSLGDGTTDIWMSKMQPQVRTLITSAYGTLNTPKSGEVEAFLSKGMAKVVAR